MSERRYEMNRERRQVVVRFAVYGVLVGFMFPLGATLFDIALQGLPLAFRSVVAVQAGQPLHWVIDSAPFVIGTAGLLLGVRQRQLLEFSDGLDSTVRARTVELAAAADRLQTIGEVGNAIAGERDLESLLNRVVTLLIDRFDFYHAQVFLVDEPSQEAVLRASTGVAGQELLKRKHSIKVGAHSVIGRVTVGGEPVLAFDTDVDAVHQTNELLPATRSEMALPLRVGGRTFGALDLQSAEEGAFSQEDVPAFQNMADQLAVAIENVELLVEARQNLKDIQALNRKLSGEAWVDFLANRGASEAVGYKADDRGLHALDDSASIKEDDAGDITSMPLVVRGQTVGLMEVKPGEGEELDREVQAILEAVSERVALALDNTRLAEQAQRSAQRQMVVNEYSHKLQRTSDLQSVLELVATEVGRILGVPRAFVQMETRPGADIDGGA